MTTPATPAPASPLDIAPALPAQVTTTITLSPARQRRTGLPAVVTLPGLTARNLNAARYRGSFAAVSDLHVQLGIALENLYGTTRRAQRARSHDGVEVLLRRVAFEQMSVDYATERVAKGYSAAHRPIL